MPKKNEAKGDFRYEAGDSRVPWHAVGECFNHQDVLEVVKFLMRPGADAGAWKARVKSVAAALKELSACSGPATKLTLGKEIAAAEEAVREFLGVKHACVQANWTSGMEVAYKLSGLGPGDEVIVPAITFIATIVYPLSIGAKVVFADVDPATVNIDPADVARKITKKTRVIVPVHIGGYPCAMDALMKIARDHDVYVMEDAAHGFGGKYKGKFLGTIGHFGGYSFHEVKNINSFGEGGVLVSNLALGKQFAKARFCGLDFTRQIPNWLYDVTALDDRFGNPQVAENSSATELTGLGIRLQLARLPKILAARAANAAILNEAFADEPGILLPPPLPKGSVHTWHLYLLRIDPAVVGADVQTLKAKLKEKGVTEIAHFGPLYEFTLLDQLGYDRAAIARTCPQTEAVFNHGYTHLPLYPLTRKQVKFMAGAVIDSVRELRGAK